eukprot:868515-Rhodomonas_salina.1
MLRQLQSRCSSTEMHAVRCQSKLTEYVSAMPLRTDEVKVQDWAAEMHKFEGKGEGFIVPTQVNYVGKGGPMFAPGEETSGSYGVVARYPPLPSVVVTLVLPRLPGLCCPFSSTAT